MIVIVGSLAWRDGDAPGPAGRASDIASAAAGAGARTEIVARVGDDPTGDAVLLALARAGIGHVAVLRDASRPTPVIPARATAVDEGISADDAALDDVRAENADASIAGPALDAADVSLGLHYLTAFGVLVVTDDVPDVVVPVAIEAAGFAGAHLVLLTPAEADAPPVSSATTILAAPSAADRGAFAQLVGAYAAGLDGGIDPGAAFATAVERAGWEALAPSA